MLARPCVLNAGCPSRDVLARVCDKWTALIIRSPGRADAAVQRIAAGGGGHFAEDADANAAGAGGGRGDRAQGLSGDPPDGGILAHPAGPDAGQAAAWPFASGRKSICRKSKPTRRECRRRGNVNASFPEMTAGGRADAGGGGELPDADGGLRAVAGGRGHGGAALGACGGRRNSRCAWNRPRRRRWRRSWRASRRNGGSARRCPGGAAGRRGTRRSRCIVCVLDSCGLYAVQWRGRGGGWIAGRHRAGRSWRGEWWRAFTALTLHADIGHLGANLAAGLVYAAFLLPIFGSGWTWLFIVLAGARAIG